MTGQNTITTKAGGRLVTVALRAPTGPAVSLRITPDSSRHRGDINRGNRRNRFHHINPPGFRRSITPGAHDAHAVDDAPGMATYPPAQAAAIDVAPLASDVDEDFPQFRAGDADAGHQLDGIPDPPGCLAKFREPGFQEARQGFAIRVLGDGGEDAGGGVGAAQPEQGLAAEVGPVAIAGQGSAGSDGPAGDDVGADDGQGRRDIIPALAEDIAHQVGPGKGAGGGDLALGREVDAEAAPGHVLHRADVVTAGQEQGAGADGGGLGDPEDAPAHELGGQGRA